MPCRRPSSGTKVSGDRLSKTSSTSLRLEEGDWHPWARDLPTRNFIACGCRSTYLDHLLADDAWGGSPEIVAFANLHSTVVEVRDTASGREVAYDGTTQRISFGPHWAPTVILRRHLDDYEFRRSCQGSLHGAAAGTVSGGSASGGSGNRLKRKNMNAEASVAACARAC